MTDTEVESVTTLVRHYCPGGNVVDADRDPADTPERGRFVLLQGPKRKAATSKRAPVVWGPDGDRVLADVLRRARDLAANGEGHVWVAAYAEGGKHPIEEVRIDGRIDEEDDEPPSTGDAIASLTWAMVQTNRVLIEDNRELRATVRQYHSAAIEATEQLTLATVHSRLLEDARADESIKEAVEALGPTLEKVGPTLASWLFGGGGLPEEPVERIREGIRRTLASVQDIGNTISANPAAVGATPGLLDPLVQLVQQLAPHLGLQVVPIGAAEGA